MKNIIEINESDRATMDRMGKELLRSEKKLIPILKNHIKEYKQYINYGLETEYFNNAEYKLFIEHLDELESALFKLEKGAI